MALALASFELKQCALFAKPVEADSKVGQVHALPAARQRSEAM
jgi:hypothetical protein